MSMATSERQKLHTIIQQLKDQLQTNLPFDQWQATHHQTLNQALDIERQLQQIQRPIYLLLLGGTGVGKSSLLNALVREY